MTPSGENAHSFEPPWAPIPGPVNRTSFFEAQRRNRRATRRLSLSCLLAILFTGIPLPTVVVMLIGLNFVFVGIAFAIILALVRLIP